MLTDPKNGTILVTGGSGFVGANFALHWKAEYPGSRVIALDNLKRRGSELNLPRLKRAGVEFVHGDVRDQADLMTLPKIDALVECSAEPSVLAAYQGGSRYVVDTNLLGTVNCLELVARDKADIVFLSTSRVYPIAAINDGCTGTDGRFMVDTARAPIGMSANGISEEFPLAGVRSLYGTTKLASELLIAEYADMHGFRYVIDRCGVIAGPWQMGRTDQGFVLLWITHHHWGLPLRYTGFGGRGAQVRDVLHVADLCDLVTLQLGAMDKVNGETFNAGGGMKNSADLNGFTALAEKVTGRRIRIDADPADRPGDLKLYVTDNTRLTERTGWSPKRDLNAVFQDSFDWLIANEEQLRAVLAPGP